MNKTLILQGKLAFPNMVTENQYSGKKQFNLTFPENLRTSIEGAVRKIVDEEQYDGFFESIKHKKFKSGKELVSKGYENFEGRDFTVLRQDGFGWDIQDSARNTIDPESLGMDDGVKVLISIGTVKHPAHGPMVFLNPKIIQLIRSAGNAGKEGYNLEGEALGEAIEIEKLDEKSTQIQHSDGEEMF